MNKLSIFVAAALGISIVFGILSGNYLNLGSASLEGAGAAAEFVLSAGGLICLWSGVLNVMRRAGLTDALARLLRPILRRLFPAASRDGETLAALSANVSANLLGLGNAATPMGIKAAQRMARLGEPGVAGRELCLLVVLNTASIQLLPTTVAALRAAEGAALPFDILPAVWLCSAGSVCAGLLAAGILGRVWPR